VLARADVIEGIRFAALADVLRWKQLLGRSKDRLDIATLSAYLAVPPDPHRQ
jgi:hypothetical protein